MCRNVTRTIPSHVLSGKGCVSISSGEGRIKSVLEALPVTAPLLQSSGLHHLTVTFKQVQSAKAGAICLGFVVHPCTMKGFFLGAGVRQVKKCFPSPIEITEGNITLALSGSSTHKMPLRAENLICHANQYFSFSLPTCHSRTAQRTNADTESPHDMHNTCSCSNSNQGVRQPGQRHSPRS